MNLTAYHESDREQNRTKDLMRLVPSKMRTILDAGARDGFLSMKLIKHCEVITALDLEKPKINHKKIRAIQGDITELNFPDDSFDLVLCSEVLEHIPKHCLKKACTELARVAKNYLIVGVPYMQDTRVGRTTCYSCGKKNPPWGHVNCFNVSILEKLFSNLVLEKISFVGVNNSKTNFISAFLMDLAGNPYGTYSQEEKCIYCGREIKAPPSRNLFQKICTKGSLFLQKSQAQFIKSNPNWIHILFKKKS